MHITERMVPGLLFSTEHVPQISNSEVTVMLCFQPVTVLQTNKKTPAFN